MSVDNKVVMNFVPTDNLILLVGKKLIDILIKSLLLNAVFS